MIVTINEKEYKIKKSFRSILLFESSTGKAFSLANTSDLLQYFYCILLTQGCELKVDEFIDWVDENEGVMTEFMSWLVEEKKAEDFTTNDEGAKKKKKVTK